MSIIYSGHRREHPPIYAGSLQDCIKTTWPLVVHSAVTLQLSTELWLVFATIMDLDDYLRIARLPAMVAWGKGAMRLPIGSITLDEIKE